MVSIINVELREKLFRISGQKLTYVETSDELSQKEISSLVLEASVLSQGSDLEKQFAYDIITKILEISPDQSSGLLSACRIILARIGNFPGLLLIDDRFKQQEDSSWWNRFEEAIRKAENSIHVMGHPLPIILNDFQYDYLEKFDKNLSLSVSGPTSIGKSFALSLVVAKTIQQNPNAIIAYLVPTRALIRQVSRDLRIILKKNETSKTIITSVPRFIEKKNENESVIYVLTQERFHGLLFSAENKESFDLIVVDEATELSSAGRGAILERSIQYALSKFNAGKIVFSSALCSNPEFILTLFNLSNSADTLISRLSPVSQNIFYLEEVALRPKKANVLQKSADSQNHLGILELPFSFRGSKRLPGAALHFTQKGDSSIVYASGASSAEKYATAMADLINEDFTSDPEVLALCEFLQTSVHKDYSLIRCLKKGVGFHYGSMPDIVREEIESLFSQRKIPFICCTSTLLQGVNLPAKNIFLFNPKKGIGRPIEPHDFWNLVGRAGRMGKEFQGNIWCIAKESWDTDPTSGSKETSIRDTFSKEVEEKSELILEALGNSLDVSDKGVAVEQTVSRIISEYFIDGNDISKSTNHTINDIGILRSIEALKDETIKKINLPNDILRKNPTYSPWRLQDLKQRILSKPLTEAIPMKQFDSGAYGRLSAIIELLGQSIVPMHGSTFKYVTWLANQWMQGVSLGQLIDGAIKWKQSKGEKVETEGEISSVIREVIDNVDDWLRFKLVSGFKAYTNILSHCLIEQGMPDLIEKIPPLHIYLEFGTANPTTLALIGTGLSRSTALELERTGLFSGVQNEQEVLERLKKIDINGSHIPTLCKKELSRLFS